MHLLESELMTCPGGHLHPLTHSVMQIGLGFSQELGQGEAQLENTWPSILHSLTQIGQHFPLGTSSFSPDLQVGRRQLTAEQSGLQTGQHSPRGTSCISPFLHTGITQLTAAQREKSVTHTGQHSPSGTSSFSPGLQVGRRQLIAEQSGLQTGQHWPFNSSVLCPVLHTGFLQRSVEQSGRHSGQHFPLGTLAVNPGTQRGKAQDIFSQGPGMQPGQQLPLGTGPRISPALHTGGKH